VIPLSGEQYTLSHGSYTATIASVGASIRSLVFEGRDLIVPFDADALRPAFRGATLAPWPNRVIDGVYSFGGVDYVLPLTEPKRGHALHGLVAWQNFALVSQVSNRLAIATTVEAQDGYPFRVDVLVEFTLDDDGLHTLVTGTNTGRIAAPWGAAPHPYLVAGAGRVDDWTFALPASRVITVSEERLLPLDEIDVAGTEFDFQSPRAIGSTFIDHAYTGLTQHEARVTNGDTGVVMTWDSACPWVQVHTADRDDTPEISRIGLAVEPMTCPPDSFNSGTDLISLAPGESSSAGWSIASL
jgi:aldose 1-epimerase